MIINQCKKEDFKPFEKVGKRVYNISWAKEDVVNHVSKLANGEMVFTGEVKISDFCTYETTRIYGDVPNEYSLISLFKESSRVPSMLDLKSICENFKYTEKQMVVLMKDQLKRAIIKHDKSRGAKGVENFTINGINLWLDKDTRTGLLLRFQAEKSQGNTNTVLWHEGKQFPLVIEQGIQMLYAIEVYASKTYDLKESLLAEADKLESVDELIAFDKTRTSSYPTNLAF